MGRFVEPHTRENDVKQRQCPWKRVTKVAVALADNHDCTCYCVHACVMPVIMAPPVAIPFANVGEAHVEKEGLADEGLTVTSGRAVLRRILSLQQGSWFQDTGGWRGEWSRNFELF